jgi:hypothetical protein
MAKFEIRRAMVGGTFALALALAAAGDAAAQDTGLNRACVDQSGNRPEVTLVADQTSVQAGTRVRLTASGKSSRGAVEYLWHADNGRIFGRGATVEFDTSNLGPGRYDVVVMGRDIKCVGTRVVSTIEVYGCPPGLRLSANNVRVNAGEVVTVRAEGIPTGFGLRWTTSEGRLVESGDSVTIDTAGISGDTITVSAVALDVPGCSSDITVAVAKPPVALPDILTFPMTGGRLNNANKAVLDDVTIRGSQDVRSRIVITGKSSANERAGLAQRRADNARNYLVGEKGVDPSRIEIRTEERTAAQGGIEIAIIPPGAP